MKRPKLPPPTLATVHATGHNVVMANRLAARLDAQAGAIERLTAGIATLRAMNDREERDLAALTDQLARAEIAQTTRHSARLADILAEADRYAALTTQAQAETRAARIALTFDVIGEA